MLIYICESCGKASFCVYDKICPFCRNREKNRERCRNRYRGNVNNCRDKARENNIRLKKEVLTYYGNDSCSCVVCGENRLACLSIDHINGRGGQHRKSIGKGSGGGFYLWLKQENYPSGYQTLCMNCQWVKKDSKKELNKVDKNYPCYVK